MDSSINEILLRRSAYLIDEAKVTPKRDQSITFTMRVLSNYVSVGKDTGSSGVKLNNLMISERAFEDIFVSNKPNWLRNTINEHPEPLKQTWEWIVAECNNLRPEDVVDRFIKNPMATITKDEDAELSKRGYRSSGEQIERYAAAGIIVKKRPASPNYYFKSQNTD